MKYVTDEEVLRKKCKKCLNSRKGLLVGTRLLEILKEDPRVLGLAANQVGIDLAVCVVKVTKPIIFVNPEIIDKFGKTFFQEACLSLPGNYVLTERWTNIVVRCGDSPTEMIFSFEKNPLECVCVQHEIDHLNGITMLERAVDMEIFNVEN